MIRAAEDQPADVRRPAARTRRIIAGVIRVSGRASSCCTRWARSATNAEVRAALLTRPNQRLAGPVPAGRAPLFRGSAKSAQAASLHGVATTWPAAA